MFFLSAASKHSNYLFVLIVVFVVVVVVGVRSGNSLRAKRDPVNSEPTTKPDLPVLDPPRSPWCLQAGLPEAAAGHSCAAWRPSAKFRDQGS